MCLLFTGIFGQYNVTPTHNITYPQYNIHQPTENLQIAVGRAVLGFCRCVCACVCVQLARMLVAYNAMSV